MTTQGIKYELTADDKASPVAKAAADNVSKAADASAQASKKAGKAASDAGDDADEAAKKGVNGFNAMSAAASAMRGDFTSMGRELGKLFTDSAKDAAELAANIGVIGTAISAVISFGSALKDLIDKAFNLGNGLAAAFSSSLADAKAKALEYADALKEANKSASDHNNHLLAIIDAENRLAKAQQDLARQRELAGAQSDDERAEINRRYDLSAQATDEQSRDEKLTARRLALEDEENRINEQIYASRKRERDMRKLESEAFAAGHLDTATNARNQYGQEVETQAALEVRLREISRAQELLLLEERAQHTEDAARHQKNDNDAAALLAAQFEQRFASQLEILKSYYGDDWRYATDLNDGAAAVRDLAIQREAEKVDADYAALDDIEQNTSYLKAIYTLLSQD